MLGKSPKDFKINAENWGVAEKSFPDETEDAKNYYRKYLLEQLITAEISKKNDQFGPKDVCEQLISHCLQITTSGRNFLQENPSKRLPDDHKLYPGKMDHSTCVVVKVGHFV